MGRAAKSTTAARGVSRPSASLDPALPGAGLRLLKALAEPRALASPDPIAEGSVVVRAATGGISLGRGRHDAASLDELVRRGLAERAGEGRRPAFAISAAGRAFLRRRDAAAPELAFAAQHREMTARDIAGDDGVERVAVNAQESPLAWLRRRRDRDGEPLIDAAAFEAGERLRRDLTFAQLLPSVTARWDGAIGGGGGGVRDPASAADTVIAARQRVRSAISAVGGDLGDLLIDLCGFLKGLELIERERTWPPRSAKVVVRLALRQLARHYGLEPEARGPSASRGLRSWSAELDAA